MLRQLVTCLAFTVGCRGTPPSQQQPDDIARLVDSLRPVVERATGMRFKGPTKSAMKTREEVHDYLMGRLQEDFPPNREQGIQAVYRLLGLIPDTLELKPLLLDLYTEQVAGFYDPGTSTLYGVRGADPMQLRLVLAHELVHAIQHQYLPLDSIMKSKGNADQQSAAQAIFEGHATIASIQVLAPGQNLLSNPQFWSLFRQQVKAQQTSMKVFARTPLALQEELVFPYLNGAEFMHWWDSARVGQPLPTLETLPRSTEQIMHPERYQAGDAPLPLRFADSSADVLYEDTLGELDLQILGAVLKGMTDVPTNPVAGWGGDRFRVYRLPADGPALLWYLVFDDAASAGRFVAGTGGLLQAKQRVGYRTLVEQVAGAAQPTVRVVIAPASWSRWSRLPRLR